MENKLSILRSRLFTGHSGPVYSLLQYGENFISSGSDGVVALWNFENQDEGLPIAKAKSVVYAMELLNDNNTLLLGQGEGGIHVIDLNNKIESKLLQYSNAPIFKIASDHKNKNVIALDGSGNILLIDPSSFDLVKRIKLLDGKLRALEFHSSGGHALVGASDGCIYVFSIPDWQLIKKIEAHKPDFSVYTLKYIPSSGLLISGSRDAHLNIYDPASDYKQVDSIPGHNYAIYSIAFSPEGSLFATASRDKSIKIWNTDTLQVAHKIYANNTEGHKNSVNTLLWHSDGMLISGSDDRSIMAWSLPI